MADCLVALGSNLGDRAALVHEAIARLGALEGVRALRASSLYRTRPVGGPADQPEFLNVVVSFEFAGPAEALHAQLQQIEQQLGRDRSQPWGARTIDLDLLLYGDQVIETPRLVVPHPRMAFRRFVIEPAAEIAPAVVHPLIGWSMARLLAHLDTAAPYVPLLDTGSGGARELAQRVATATGARFLADPEAAQPASRAGDASPNLRRAIELVRQRGSLASGKSWPGPGKLTVSDFYFDQSLAHAEARLEPDELAEFRREFERLRAQVVLPKLLVVLDTRPSPQAEPSAPSDDAGQSTLRERLLALAARRGLGPLLYVGRDNPDAQFQEVVAAIEAMQAPPHE